MQHVSIVGIRWYQWWSGVIVSASASHPFVATHCTHVLRHIFLRVCCHSLAWLIDLIEIQNAGGLGFLVAGSVRQWHEHHELVDAKSVSLRTQSRYSSLSGFLWLSEFKKWETVETNGGDHPPFKCASFVVVHRLLISGEFL
jgi:hypothetical protein